MGRPQQRRLRPTWALPVRLYQLTDAAFAGFTGFTGFVRRQWKKWESSTGAPRPAATMVVRPPRASSLRHSGHPQGADPLLPPPGAPPVRALSFIGRWDGAAAATSDGSARTGGNPGEAGARHLPSLPLSSVDAGGSTSTRRDGATLLRLPYYMAKGDCFKRSHFFHLLKQSPLAM